MTQTAHADLLGYTADIVAAHLKTNTTAPEGVSSLISSVYDALRTLDDPKPSEPAALVPAVPVKRSVFPDFLICLEDGKKMKTMKRHLASRYNLTPQQYRAKWGLPPNYPMVAPAYTERRSILAKQIGLGRVRQPVPAAPARKKATPVRKRARV